MTPAGSIRGRRYLAIWFPFLPTDRRLRSSGRAAGEGPDEAPVVLVERDGGALRLAAADAAALALGLNPGTTLADAQARAPHIVTATHQPAADDALLEQVLQDFGRFSPSVALDPPHGLILDTTGGDHLFGGETLMLRQAVRRAARIGLSARGAVAGSPQAARALVRFGPGGVVAPGEDRRATRPLSIAALELNARDHQALIRAGLKTLGDLDDRPSASLAARFGADFPTRLNRILGREDVRITPSRPAAPCVADRIFAEPLGRVEDAERVLDELLAEACAWLETHGRGGRAFSASFFRVDGQVRRVTVRTGRATREPRGLGRLFRERLAALANPLDPGFGFDQMRLEVGALQPLALRQSTMEARPDPADELGGLVDRLTARLGPHAVSRLHPVESHLPERADRSLAASAPAASACWPDLDPDDPPLRPLHLFDPPQPIETMAVVPDGSPLRFRWRRVQHEVTRAEGPERIEPEWWLRRGRARDYYRVEDRDGRRFWLFRAGLYGEARAPAWFIQGLFP